MKIPVACAEMVLKYPLKDLWENVFDYNCSPRKNFNYLCSFYIKIYNN